MKLSMDDAPETLSSQSVSIDDPEEERSDQTPEESVQCSDNSDTGIPNETAKQTGSESPTTAVPTEVEVEGSNPPGESDSSVPDLENLSNAVPDSPILHNADTEQEEIEMGVNSSSLEEEEEEEDEDVNQDISKKKKKEEGNSSTNGMEDGFFNDHADWAEILISDDELDSGGPEESHARLEWLTQKRECNEENEYLDQIMAMVGHEKVKEHFLAVKARIDVAKRWNEDIKTINMDLFLQGNDGTGRFSNFIIRYMTSMATDLYEQARGELPNFTPHSSTLLALYRPKTSYEQKSGTSLKKGTHRYMCACLTNPKILLTANR
jgi:hypothetical protein